MDDQSIQPSSPNLLAYLSVTSGILFTFVCVYMPIKLQLKNMINALFLSKTDGSKQFQRVDKCAFGWKAIDDLYQRELERKKQGLARMVPRLKETHFLRDSWTKLNVHPAKILQVCLALNTQV